MELTPIYKLKKPGYGDLVDVGVINENSDTIDVALSNKTDKVPGKTLSSNDYTNEDKTKVAGIPDNPKYTDTLYDDSKLVERVERVEAAASTHYVKKTNLTVQLSAWTASSYSDWPFKASIKINGCTADYVCDVIFNAEQISMGIFAQFAETSADRVTIFAEEKPDAAITIPVIELRK